jgi:phosphate/sulfate permease
MDLSTFYMLAGFVLAAYAVVANDSVQTLGTFISSQRKLRWYYLWVPASVVMVSVLTWGWATNGGDMAFGRLAKIPQPETFHWYHVAAPAVLLVMTRFGLPVSTTFLVLSVFASNVVLESMLVKSAAGYAVAAVTAYVVWFALSRVMDEHLPVTNPKHEKAWRVGQWFATGFLWASWLMHDMANIAVYLPRQVEAPHFAAIMLLLTVFLGIVFYQRGGSIQKVVLNKSGTRYVRSATIIDLVYACVLLVFKDWSNIPMSTTWVFVGLLCGRELAVYRLHDPDKHLMTIFPIVAKDFFKILLGLAVSIVLVLIVAAMR